MDQFGKRQTGAVVGRVSPGIVSLAQQKAFNTCLRNIPASQPLLSRRVAWIWVSEGQYNVRFNLQRLQAS